MSLKKNVEKLFKYLKQSKSLLSIHLSNNQIPIFIIEKLIQFLDVIAPKKFLVDHDFLVNNSHKKDSSMDNNSKLNIKLLDTEQDDDLDIDSFQIIQESKIINTHIMEKIN